MRGAFVRALVRARDGWSQGKGAKRAGETTTRSPK